LATTKDKELDVEPTDSGEILERRNDKPPRQDPAPVTPAAGNDRPRDEVLDTTAEGASRSVGGGRTSDANVAAGNPDLPEVAGPDASKEERERAIRSQRPGRRTEINEKSKVTLRSGGTVTVEGDQTRVATKLRSGQLVTFRAEDGTEETIDGRDVARVEQVKKSS
jgi:hypothetical protein